MFIKKNDGESGMRTPSPPPPPSLPDPVKYVQLISWLLQISRQNVNHFRRSNRHSLLRHYLSFKKFARLHGTIPGGEGGGGLPCKKGWDARRTSLGLKSWVWVPLRVFKAKYLHLHTTRYLLGVPRSIEWHFI